MFIAAIDYGRILATTFLGGLHSVPCFLFMKEAYFSQYQLVAAYTHSLFKGKRGEQLPVFWLWNGPVLRGGPVSHWPDGEEC